MQKAIIRIEGCHWFLEDHGDIVPANLPHFRIRTVEKVVSLEQHLPPVTTAAFGNSLITDKAVRLFPQHDSPTIPRTSPGTTSN
ncbi:hypothetical protein GGD56_006841 [Rhizobium mongolense]|uniref:Uncharacterized protein n=1 Tax=Rhizobium mongolense TaxID=57676 RepID=A0ABR6IYE2_9HYPH|nr:hypothetical protein [Rhizobium mongolense]